MIIDLPRFVAAERDAWHELEKLLERLAADRDRSLSYTQAKRFHFLYQKASADLARLSGFTAESELRQHLESLVARSYGEIHGTRSSLNLRHPFRWFTQGFPKAFRRCHRAFQLSLLVTMLGVLFGGFAILAGGDAKEILLPGQFSHLNGTPSERVAKEESQKSDGMAGRHSTFASYLIQNNIHVSLSVLATGMLWGLGPLVQLFQNGVILGLICVDYLMDGQWVFLLGWLMPHGVIEIPSILFAGQAGFVLGGAVIGSGNRLSLSARLRAVSKDVTTLILGTALFLVWAGIVESFLSQHHQPEVPYWAKIAFGCVEFALLIWFLYFKNVDEPAVGSEKALKP